MSSIITNNSAIAALQTLRNVNSSLQGTQQRVSSGYRVDKAADNAAYWSIATTMRSDNKATSAVHDSIGLGQAILDTTYTGMSQIIEEMSSIKALLVTAKSLPTPATSNTTFWYSPGTDPLYEGSSVAKVDAEIVQHFRQINSIINSSSYNGVNLLRNDTTDPLPGSTTEFVIGYSGGKVQTASLPKSDTVMVNYNRKLDGFWTTVGHEEFGLLDELLPFGYANNSLTYYDSISGTVQEMQSDYFLHDGESYMAHVGVFERQQEYDSLIQYFEVRMQAVQAGAASVGSMQKRLEMQEEFTKGLMEDTTTGIGRLVDADMEEESSKLTALQTQQQLAVQSLSIANNAPKNILTLFRG